MPSNGDRHDLRVRLRVTRPPTAVGCTRPTEIHDRRSVSWNGHTPAKTPTACRWQPNSGDPRTAVGGTGGNANEKPRHKGGVGFRFQVSNLRFHITSTAAHPSGRARAALPLPPSSTSP